jgi:hypothetical protein
MTQTEWEQVLMLLMRQGFKIVAHNRLTETITVRLPHASSTTTQQSQDHGSGIALQDLTSFMESFNDYVMSRIKGVGADQYMKSTGQLFETFTVQETVDELLAELADTIAYTNFIAIKVIALSNAIKDKQ